MRLSPGNSTPYHDYPGSSKPGSPFQSCPSHLSGSRSNSLVFGHSQESPAAGPLHAFTIEKKRSKITVINPADASVIARLHILKKRKNPTEAEIRGLWTHPLFANRGIATQLLTDFLTAARKQGLRLISVQDTARNYATGAHSSIYKRLGFQQKCPEEPCSLFLEL